MAWPHCESSMASTIKYFFLPHHLNQFLFLRQITSASAVNPILSPTNVITYSDTASCASPMILPVWVTLPSRTSDSFERHPTVSVCLDGGGVGFVTFSLSCTSDSASLLSLSVLVCGGEC